MGVARRDVGLLLPILVRLAVVGGELAAGRRFVRLGAGDGENVAIWFVFFACGLPPFLLNTDTQ
jgi:hypothetical protein